MKKQREDEQVIDDGEERSRDGTKSDDPQKRDDDKINRKRKREDEQVIDDDVERSSDGRRRNTLRRTKSDDPQKRDDKINRKREDEQVIDDDVERSSDSYKGDGPFRAVIRTQRPIGSGDSTRALGIDEAEGIMARTTAIPSTSNNAAGAIQAPAPPPPTAQASPLSKVASSVTKCFKGALISPIGSGDSSLALSTHEAEEIISRTISSMTAGTTTAPSTSNNTAGAP